MTSINTNVGTLMARSNAINSATRQQSAMTRLSSGRRINSAGDDAAGMAVSNKMLSQLTGMEIALRNMMDSASLIQTASSAVSEITSMVTRMRELSVQMANGIFSSSDRVNGQLEIRALLNEISKTAETTNFNDVKLLDGSYQNIIRAGHSNSELINLAIDGMSILPYIKGASSASSTFTETILRPDVLAYGTSALNFLSSSASRGTSSLTLANNSNALGSSSYETLQNSFASGTNQLEILSQTNAIGTSNFLTPAISSASGLSNLDYLSSVSASGTSAFNTPASSTGSGSSVLNVLATAEAGGQSSFNYLATSRATGTSQLDYVTNTVGTGTSAFNTPSSSTGSGSSTLTIQPTQAATLANSSDNANESTASGVSDRSVLNSSTGSGTSSLNYLRNTTATGSSTVSGIPSNTNATLTRNSTLDAFNFDNGDFSSGGSGSAGSGGSTASIQGWDIYLNQVSLSSGATSLPKTIAGFNVPTDTNTPSSVGDTAAITQFDTTPIEYFYNASNNKITLGTGDVNTTSNGQMHGPYIVSKEAAELVSGDRVSFQWQATGAGDRADVYAYLLDVDTGNTITLLDETASTRGSTSLTTINRTLSAEEAGNYKFVFISGSYDADGGGKLGSSLSLSNVSITQANPEARKVTTARATLTAQESQSVSIDKTLLGQLNRVANANPGGQYSILNTKDGNKFSLNSSNNIVSSALLLSNKSTYSFDVRYLAAGGVSHTETVTINITTAQGANSTFSAQEADRVTIASGSLNLMSSFAGANPGTYALGTTGDQSSFSINSTTGEIWSRAPLDFDTKKNYNFDVIFTTFDGSKTFNNNVALTLTDTLTSSASITAEESNQISIAATSLSTINSYALEDSKQGAFSLSGSDANLFTVNNNGDVTTKPGTSLLIANRGNYNFTVNYRNTAGITHSENVSLNLFEALQATSNLTASQANIIKINPNSMAKISGYAARNGPGQFSFQNNSDDHTLFDLNSTTGAVQSKSGQIDYNQKQSYQFTITFTPTGSGKSFSETVTLNVNNPNESFSAFEATEVDQVQMRVSDMANLSAFVGNNPGGSYTLSGTDAGKFEYDAVNSQFINKGTTNLKLGNNDTYNYEKNYSFDITYTLGGQSHTESVTLKINESLNAASTLTAHEATQVTVNTTGMSELLAFKARDRNQGSFSFSNDSVDANKFNINSVNGTITSKNALDFSDQETYSFKVVYTAASDARQFIQDVTLNLQDTLNSTASIKGEEASSVTIEAATLTSSAKYVSENTGGTYALSGTDAAKFDIDLAGRITSKAGTDITLDNQASYNFNVDYTANSITHSEAVTFTPDRAKQGSSTVSAQEADRVELYIDNLTKLSAFVSADGNNGTYSFGTGQGLDYQKFQFDSFGNIESTGALDFNDQQSYVFDVVYTGSIGTFTDTVTLNLTDTLTSTATLSTEETDQLTIAASTLSSTANYASENPGGTYSLSGTGATKLDIDTNTGVITSKVGQKILFSDQPSLSFNVIYTNAGVSHTEAVELTINRALQADATITAKESGKVSISADQLTYISAFKNAKGTGSFSLANAGGANAGDQDSFTINGTTGLIESVAALDFNVQSQYVFDVKYARNDGKIFTTTLTLNLEDSLTSTATLSAEEADALTISSSTLSSTNQYATANSGGTYTLSGTDAGKFDINSSDGTITTKIGQTLHRSDQSSYNFDVNYTNGGITHREAVTLNLTEAMQAQSVLESAEASQVKIQATALQKLYDFRSRNPYGSWNIVSSSTDASYFNFDSYSGEITSVGALDFTTKQNYNFDVQYVSGSGKTFTEKITLNLSDTLASKANLTAEETDRLTIGLDVLTSTNEYKSQNAGGKFSLSGADAGKFTIDEDTGALTSKVGASLLTANQETYDFNVDYSKAGVVHSEAVAITLTEALQSSTTVSAKEAATVNIELSQSPQMQSFANRDNAVSGQFYLTSSNGDAAKFDVLDNGNVISRSTLEFDEKSSYQFTLNYRATDSRIFKTDINLNLTETLNAKAVIAAEQSREVKIALNELTSTKAFYDKYTGGTFNIGGKDSSFFELDGSNNIVSKAPLLISAQEKYELSLLYTSPAGETHTETITLNLTETMQASATHTAQEATQVFVRPGELEYLYGYATRDGFNGTWSIDSTKADAAKFDITASGALVSKTALDFSTQSSFDLGIHYTNADRTKTFKQDITLNLNDTVTAIAKIESEESDSVAISLNSFAATKQYMSDTSANGSFSLNSKTGDHKKFNIDADTGRIESAGQLRLQNQEKFQFDVIYTNSGYATFTEAVTLELKETTYGKSKSKLNVSESEIANISLDQLPNIQKFYQNNSGGTFTLKTDLEASSDYLDFEVTAEGNISSLKPLDFETSQNNINFVLEYKTAAGQIYEESISLDIINDLRDDNILDLASMDISTVGGANKAIDLLDQTLTKLTSSQAKLGATLNRVEHSIDNLLSMTLKTKIALGRITDADFATETANLSREQILSNAATAMLAQATNSKNNVLRLLNI